MTEEETEHFLLKTTSDVRTLFDIGPGDNAAYMFILTIVLYTLYKLDNRPYVVSEELLESLKTQESRISHEALFQFQNTALPDDLERLLVMMRDTDFFKT
jgi:hypothetical protein